MARTHSVLISIVRRPGELFALVSERDTKAEEPQTVRDQVHAARSRVSRSLYPRKEKLQESWRYLAKVTAADEETLYHVLIVAIESVPDLSIAATPPPLPLEWGAPQVRPKATSAHPRAFKGTKYQPPKGARLAPIRYSPVPVRHRIHPGSARTPAEVPTRKSAHAWRGTAIPRCSGRDRTRALPGQREGRAKMLDDAVALRASTFGRCFGGGPREMCPHHLSLYVALELEKDDRLLWSVSRFIAASEGRPRLRVVPSGRRFACCIVAFLLSTRCWTSGPMRTRPSPLCELNWNRLASCRRTSSSPAG